jgi:multiple sugar transport system substrate-binding protein
MLNGLPITVNDIVKLIASSMGGEPVPRSVRMSMANAWVYLTAALALVAVPARADDAAQRAVQAARKYTGATITLHWQAGLQALDPKEFSGPLWEKLTGIKVRVIETALPEMFVKTLQDHRAGTGSLDVLDVSPAWLPDLAEAGALEPLDPYMDRFGFREELQGISPAYRDNQMTHKGRNYAVPDDGDVVLLYYRTDIFSNATLRSEFRKLHGRDLAPPDTWQEFDRVGSFLAQRMKRDEVYGATYSGDPALAHYLFQERFRDTGGRFFDARTMRATINSPAGVAVFTAMRHETRFMPPGVEKFTFAENLAVFLAGQAAMTISWPPVGRWAAGYGGEHKALGFVPKSKVAGKVGYALPPGGRPQLAIGHALSVSSNSRNKEAAWLFIQWINSEEISLQRVQLPYALRDPFRTSHFASPEYRARWPDAGEYLSTLGRAAEIGMLDLSLIATDKYEEALRQGLSRLWAGEDPKAILDDVAAEWDRITSRVGVEKQRAAYSAWMAKGGAYPD